MELKYKILGTFYSVLYKIFPYIFATFFIILFFVVFTQIKLSYNNKTFHGIIINKHIVNYKGVYNRKYLLINFINNNKIIDLEINPFIYEDYKINDSIDIELSESQCPELFTNQ
jgi:hypothetical protein